jgi:ribosomal protein S6--L-glutamate ligase
MRRTAQGGDFRSNVHRGGLAEPVELDDQYRDTAVRSAQILGLKVAGVDLLEGKDGPQVMEVNSSPGLEGIEGATKLDVAGAIIDFIEGQVSFPELDVRQRLSVSASYGVTELHLGESSELVGQTIRDSELREKDIVVLTLHQGHTVIPNPKGSRVLEVDDRLLCFGKLEAMKDLVPARQRRKRPKVKRLRTKVGATGESS